MPAATKATPALRQLRRYGYVVPNRAAFERAKETWPMQHGSWADAFHLVAPRTGGRLGWNGVSGLDSNFVPSDSTGAIGATRYVEMTNGDYAIYTRKHRRLTQGPLGDLIGAPQSGLANLTDPQIIWDPGSHRFYYVVLDANPTTAGFFMGFSRTATPNGAGSWCQYQGFNYGATIPDQPHLGDAKGIVFWGVSVFDNTNNPPRADVDWMTKPRQATGCPAPNTLAIGMQTNLRTRGGRVIWRPTGVNQIDSAKNGWVIGDLLNSGDHLYLFKVHRGASSVSVQRVGTPLAVRPYSLPRNAPQKGTTVKVDAGDGSLLKAVSAYDPRYRTVGVWTSQTIRGAKGDNVRWYEVNPGHAKLLRSQKIAGGSVYLYNSSISSDRVVNSHHAAFGRSWVMTLNTSSSSSDIRIWTAWQLGRHDDVFVPVHGSIGPVLDVQRNFCPTACSRWGDYSAATPDPAAPVRGRKAGRVWLTNGWDVSGKSAAPNWRTWNWSIRPTPRAGR